MNEIAETKAEEIERLHSEIIGHLRQSLEKAIRIGELLTEQKAGLKYGEWGGWIKETLPFSERTARNYYEAVSAEGSDQNGKHCQFAKRV